MSESLTATAVPETAAILLSIVALGLLGAGGLHRQRRTP
jgi:hypothetical protein